jgi:hypothetical protein
VYADGQFHQKSKEGAPGAELYTWENEKTGKSGESWDIIYREIEGYISEISVHESEFGKSLNVTIAWDGR